MNLRVVQRCYFSAGILVCVAAFVLEKVSRQSSGKSVLGVLADVDSLSVTFAAVFLLVNSWIWKMAVRFFVERKEGKERPAFSKNVLWLLLLLKAALLAALFLFLATAEKPLIVSFVLGFSAVLLLGAALSGIIAREAG